MYLAGIFAENFRIFGTEQSGEALRIALRPGVNAIVGENDGGKTAVIDAIRFCLWTTSQDYHRFTEDDFHCDVSGRATELTIQCRFEDLDTADAGTFMEWLSFSEDRKPILYITVRSRRLDAGKQARIAVTTHSGERGDGPAVEGVMRELLRTTYLRPLRDAEAELSSGRGSRLAQILASYPEIGEQAADDFDQGTDQATTLVGIVRRAEHHIKTNQAVAKARDHINESYFSKLQIGRDRVESVVGVASDSTLTRILEKLELAIAPPATGQERTRRGLGVNNALFMAAELLLLGAREQYPFLLVEEPEAHLHPQLQARVIELLKSKATDEKPVQVLLTTHSPTLASTIPLDSLILVCQGKTFPLRCGETRLNPSDYAFLERFLDSTKANLFFARSVAIVEGDAENILLPALGEKMGCSFGENGVSVVSVGHTGLFRYSRIFQRISTEEEIPIRVACVRDFDVAPAGADETMAKKLKRWNEYSEAGLEARRTGMQSGDGQSVRTFVSDLWTFEYDLAAASWPMAKIMHQAIQSAVIAGAADGSGNWPTDEELSTAQESAIQEAEGWEHAGDALEAAALRIYAPLRLGRASKVIAAQFAAQLVASSSLSADDLPPYIREALNYLCSRGEADAAAVAS